MRAATIKLPRVIYAPDFDKDEFERAIDKEVDMIEPLKNSSGTSELAALLRFQHDALQELIDIALTAVRESNASSVSAMHLTTRLNKLSDALKRTARPSGMPVRS